MVFNITLHITIDATSQEAARLWALEVQRQLVDAQPAIAWVGEAQVEEDK